jgi:predicted DNA-binding transcriptional regulator AlpA
MLTDSATCSELFYAARPQRCWRDRRGPEDIGAQRRMQIATELLTIPQFARATGLKYWLAWQLVRRGSIPSVLVGNRRRIDVRWVEQWLATGGYRPVAQGSAAPN